MRKDIIRSINALRYYEKQNFLTIAKSNDLDTMSITITQGNIDYRYQITEIVHIIRTALSKLRSKIDGSMKNNLPFAYVVNIEDTDKISQGKHVHIVVGFSKEKASRMKKLVALGFLHRYLNKFWPRVDINYRYCGHVDDLNAALNYNFKDFTKNSAFYSDPKRWIDRLDLEALPYFAWDNVSKTG